MGIAQDGQAVSVDVRCVCLKGAPCRTAEEALLERRDAYARILPEHLESPMVCKINQHYPYFVPLQSLQRGVSELDICEYAFSEKSTTVSVQQPPVRRLASYA